MKIKLILIIILLSGVLVLFKSEIRDIFFFKSTLPSFKDLGLSLSEDTTNCEFKTISNFTYENKSDMYNTQNRKVYYETTPNDKNLITFTDLSTNKPKLKGNVGEAQLTKIKDDTESVILVEKNNSNDIFVYTIYKKEKIATWYKSYILVNTPYAMLSMGYCY